uniref:Echinoderm microtubule-associated protein-like 1 n=1 Tax=Clastoptera arizonana TaxID=38151 RepID=A0A1B6CX03_9HEMI
MESPGDTISGVINAWNDMIETENESVRERLSDLEKKVLEQGDEIVCLRSTLADVLRRLNQLEGSRPVTVTPLKNGANRGIINNVPNNNSLSKDPLRYRAANDTNPTRDNIRRVPSYGNSTNTPNTPSSLPQRPIHKGFTSCRNISRIEEELPAISRRFCLVFNLCFCVCFYVCNFQCKWFYLVFAKEFLKSLQLYFVFKWN